MSYWGTLGPTVKLLDNDGAQVEAIVLPRPNERLVEDWVPDIEDFGETLSYTDARMRRGFRFQAKYRWTGLRAADSASTALLMKLVNWKDGKLRLWPYSDGVGRMLVRIQDIQRKFAMGSVKYDELTIEFRGIDLTPRMPDPATDRISRPYRRGHTMTAETPIA